MQIAVISKELSLLNYYYYYLFDEKNHYGLRREGSQQGRPFVYLIIFNNCHTSRSNEKKGLE